MEMSQVNFKLRASSFPKAIHFCMRQFPVISINRLYN
jgi:hypothetical protein